MQQTSNTIAAIFATERDARDGIKNLHKAGFKQTWLGKTREPDRDTGEPTVDATEGLARLLSAGAERRPLHKVLIEKGLTEPQARAVEGDIAFGNSIVTVYGEDNPDRARACLEEARGSVIDAGGAIPSAVSRASTDPRTGTVDTVRGEDRESDETLGTDVDYETEEFVATGRYGPTI